MYSRQEASQLKKEFWTAFGQYMQPILSADGEKVNWINYKTGEKDIYFRMDADNKKATIAIELSHKDAGLRPLYFDQFKELKHLLKAELNEEWIWQENAVDQYGKQSSRIYTELSGINLFNKADWPQLISFFKPRLIALDAFWSNVKYQFEMLR
jgi:hypothetical protein